MILVIFGAGASYDCNPHDRPPYIGAGVDELYALKFDTAIENAVRDRVPLANQIASPYFQGHLNQHPEATPIVMELRRRLRQRSQGMEQELERIVSESDSHPLLARQLIGFRLYLNDLIQERTEAVMTRTAGGTIYVDLLQELQRNRTEPIALVTFNYDILLDEAVTRVTGQSLQRVEDYVANPDLGLFKVHGSTSWKRPVEGVSSEALERYGAPTCISESWKDVRILDLFLAPGDFEGGRYRISEKWQLLPAIAVPTVTKVEFECPDEHLSTLRETMAQVTKVLVVGWQAMDKHFLQMWKEARDSRGIGGPLKLLTIVDRDNPLSEIVRGRLSAYGIYGGNPVAGGDGFTEFVGSNAVDEFLTLIR